MHLVEKRKVSVHEVYTEADSRIGKEGFGPEVCGMLAGGEVENAKGLNLFAEAGYRLSSGTWRAKR